MKKAKGITLVALVVTIIIMLILAGVSLNAIGGDNGLIKNTQAAKFRYGIAVLEEFLQEKYAESYVGGFDKIDKNGVEYTPLEILLKEYPEYFYQDGSKDYTVKQVTHTDSNGETQTDFLKIRLIRKLKIPKGIQDSLVGGDAVGRSGAADSYDAYEQLLDVYGVTNDLKVFYCSNGLETAEGADYLSSEAYDSGRVLYDSNSGLSKAVSATYGEEAKDLTIKDLTSVTELNIDPSSNISDLSSLADLPHLTSLTLTNYVGTLKGIEKAYNLSYIFFDNSENKQNIDFSGFEGAVSLNEIRFYKPTDNELEKMCTQMSNSDYNSLQNIYLFGGWQEYWARWNFLYYDINGEASLENISYLNSLSNNTKNAVKRLIINNTKITSLSGIENYTKLMYLQLYKNHLKNVDELKSLTSLVYLDISNNTELNSITGISNIATLSNVMMRNVPKLTDISPVVISSSPSGLDALSNTNFNFSTEIWTKDNNKLIAKLEKITTLMLDSKYSLLFLNRNGVTLSTDHTWEDVKVLENKTNINSIDFGGNKNLTNAQIQELLASLPNIRNICLDDTNVETLNFASDKTLNRISFCNTKVADIIPLYGQNALGYIRFSVFKTNNAISHKVELYRQGDETFNNKIISIIETTYDKACFGDGQYMPNGGGFVPLDTSYWSEINKLTDLTRFYICYDNSPATYNYDFSGTKLSRLNIRIGTRPTVKLPSTIETIYATYRIYFQADKIDNLKSLTGNGGALITCDNINTKFDSTQNGVTVSFNNDVTYQLDDCYQFYAHDWVGSFTFRPVRPTGRVGTFSSSMVSPMINCNYFNIFSKNIGRLDGSDFSKFTRDFTFILDGCNVTTFDNINLASKLKNLQLPNNRISDVSFFVDNYEQSNLEQLYLANNLLENITTYKKADGTSGNMKTSEILGRLPKLKYVDLSGNNSLTDFSGLLNAGFHETGNNTKIFTK